VGVGLWVWRYVRREHGCWFAGVGVGLWVRRYVSVDVGVGVWGIVELHQLCVNMSGMYKGVGLWMWV